MSMVLPRPTPPQRYRPRCGSRLEAGNQGASALSLSPAERDAARRPARTSPSRIAACIWVASNSRCRAATSAFRRASTDLGTAPGEAAILETLVVGAGTALRRHPGDLAGVRVLDVAGFAMHAVGGIDLQLLAAGAVVDHFIDVGGTEIGAGIS